MKHYAMMFRAHRPLTAPELQRREGEIQAWVKRINEMGVTLDPRILGDVAANLSYDGDHVVSQAQSSDPALVTMVFFDATGAEQAVEIARIHPALHFGVTIELREWSAPQPFANRK